MAKKKPKIGDIVYLKTDQEQKPRIIIKYEVSAGGIYYQLGQSTEATWHYQIEFTPDKIIQSGTAGFKT